MKRYLASAALLTFLASSVPAHFVWGVYRTDGVRFEFSENPGDSILEDFAGKSALLKLIHPKQSPPLVKDTHFVTLAESGPVIGARLDYGVLDRGEQGRGVFQLIYHVKAAKTLEASTQSIGLPLEISASKHSGSDVKIKVTFNGKPVVGSEVVYGCQKAKETTTKTDSKGEAILSGILPNKILFVRSSIAEAKTGTLDGKKFDSIRHYVTLTAPTGTSLITPKTKE